MKLTITVCMTTKRLITSRKIDVFAINLSSTHQFLQIAISLLIFHPVSCGLLHSRSVLCDSMIAIFCFYKYIYIMYLMVIFSVSQHSFYAGWLPSFHSVSFTFTLAFNCSHGVQNVDVLIE